MLTPEQSKVLLQAHHVKDAVERQRDVVAALPDDLRATGFAVLGRDAHGLRISASASGQRDWERERRLQEQTYQQLDALPAGRRLQIFAALHPTLGPYLELSWQFMHRLPYGQWHGSGMFRAPHRPDLTRSIRGQWLTRILDVVGALHEDVAWFARHAGYIGYGATQLDVLFAAVMDDGSAKGDEVFAILTGTALGQDEIAAMGRHVPAALLAAARPEGWNCVERLLLAAQREEGLRQMILMAAGTAHRDAFRGLLQTVVSRDLVRFTAVAQSVNSWLGTNWDAGPSAARTRVLGRLLELLNEPAAVGEALTADAESAFLALWCMATDDIETALPPAASMLADADPERRCAAVHLLAQAQIPETVDHLLGALGDSDTRVVGRACAGLSAATSLIDPTSDCFERIEAALPRLPERTLTPARPLLWELPAPAIQREQIADLLLTSLGERGPQRLITHVSSMSQYARARAANLFAESGPAHSAGRAALLNLLSDRVAWVREQAFKALDLTAIQPQEAVALEALLTRKAADLRRGILALLLKQPDELALASVDRLLSAREEPRRHAGLELLRLLHEAGRASEECARRAKAYGQSHAQLGEAERVLLLPLLDAEHVVPTLDNALGLADPAQSTAVPAPVARPVAWTSGAAVAALLALDTLIHEHREETYIAETRVDRREVLLGSENYWFPNPDSSKPIDQDVERLPFASLWRGWAEARPTGQRDADGLEFLRMLLQIDQRNALETLQYLRGLDHADEPRLPLRYPRMLQQLCGWLARLYPAPGAAEFALDYLETVLATLPEEQLRPVDERERTSFSRYQRLDHAVNLARQVSRWLGAAWTNEHAARLWRLLRWSTDLPRPHLRYHADLRETLEAQRAGAANNTDLLLQMLGLRPDSGSAYANRSFDEMAQLSARTPHRYFADYPTLAADYERCVTRVLEVELERGEMPSAATPVALSLRSVSGGQWFVRLLLALGREQLTRGHAYLDTSKGYTLSHLLRISFPTPQDTPEALKAHLAAANIPEQRLVEAALYAPQWARHIEHALGWGGFAEAVWWVYAHTRDRQWAIDAAIRKEWEARISEWTPLASADLYDGAVDVAWFARVHKHLGPGRWEAMYQAAKYSSTSTGHARARLFADAMLGKLDEQALVARITSKRHRDAACALGLVPLPASARKREHAILARYQTLQEFIRTARALGAQRRAGDQTAARIGLENLARTAGYPDAQRFQWAMELRAAADLSRGSIQVTRDDVTVVLRVDELGEAHLEASRAGRILKEIPPRVKKDPAIAGLRERHKELAQQLARMRLALELAMCREEAFIAGELRTLLAHPVLRPLLEQLVFIGAGEAAVPDLLGYLVRDGQALCRGHGTETPLAPETRLRIAHAYDLYRSGEWSAWQHECFAAERIQPFKQVFRELYVLTETERQDSPFSHRYAGQQIQPRQAMALLGQRGWITGGYEQAEPERTFHERGLTATVSFLFGGGTVADLDGLTLEGVTFHAAREAWGKPLPLADIAPIVFSEVMRDLDLVVSVAHRGGIDPESSASTIELRTALIREVCATLKLDNVRLQSSHALIKGSLAEYALHLGSGTVHRLPGGALCIVPVFSQHRGRLFLPFADDDPKTAEIVSKVLLLARDDEIKDPVILQQLFAHA